MDCETYAAPTPSTGEVLADRSGECSVVVCASLRQKRNELYARVSNYPTALDEPFEELFLRMKASIDVFETELLDICGTEVSPLPVCTNRSGIGNRVAEIRAMCVEQSTRLVDAADTVLSELLLQMAGNQRTHAYARRIDALTAEFRKVGELMARITTYLAKITLPTIVGDPVKK